MPKTSSIPGNRITSLPDEDLRLDGQVQRWKDQVASHLDAADLTLYTRSVR